MLNKKDFLKLTDCEEMKNALIMADKEWERTFNALPDLITILDTAHQVVKVNQAMANSLGVSPDQAIGKHCYEVVHGTSCPIANCPHSLLLTDGMQHTLEVKEDNLGGYFMVTATPIMDDEGNTVGSVHVARDITQRVKMENDLKNALEDKDILMKEIHHRVKNNLMVMSSLLNLQARYIEDKVARDIFKDSQSRAKSMALIHEKLYRSGDLKRLNMKEYIQKLSREIFQTYQSDDNKIEVILDLENIMLDVDTAIPLGLILNELLTNSMKYAFPEKQEGMINVSFSKNEKDKLVLEVKDNGIGLPSDFHVEKTDSLGIKLIYNLTKQINGHLDVSDDNGTHFRIEFCEKNY